MKCEEFILPDWSPPNDPARVLAAEGRLIPSDDNDEDRSEELLGWSEDSSHRRLNHLAQFLACFEAVIVWVIVDVRHHERLGQDRAIVVHSLHRPQESCLLSLGLVVEDSRWKKEIIMTGKVVKFNIKMETKKDDVENGVNECKMGVKGSANTADDFS